MANDVHVLAVAYAAAGEFMENVMHFQNVATMISATPETDSLALATAFQTTLQSLWLACMTPDVQLLGYRARRVNNTGGPSAVVPATSGLVGTVSGSTIDNTRDAAVLYGDYYDSGATKPRWRSTRIFLGGVPSTWMVDNVWITAAVTAYQAVCTALQSPIGSSPQFKYGAWSVKEGAFYTPAGAPELSPYMGSLKRRIIPHV